METLVKSESYSLREASLKLKELLRSTPLNDSFCKDNRRLVRLEVKVKEENILSWLKQQNEWPKVYWSDREEKMEMGGVGAAEIIVCPNATDIPFSLQKIQETLKGTTKSFKYFGGMCFDFHNLSDEWKDFGPFWFVLPRFELVYQKKESVLACNLIHKKINSIDVDTIVKKLGFLNFKISENYSPIPHYQTKIDHPREEEWTQQTAKQLQALGKGDFEKVVLAKETQFHFNSTIDPWDLLTHLRTERSDCYHYCFSPKSSAAFLGASPERLYERQGREIKAEAIAGTKPIGKSTQEEEDLKNNLLNSKKELREHQLVVNFIQERLSTLCLELKWNKNASLLRLKESQHLHSICEGLLKANVTDEELIFKLHPTPAVAGSPQDKALKIIRETEPFSRGWYAGPVGWIGTDSAEFAVAIRSGLLTGQKLSLFSGAGLVQGSTPQSEWEEIEHKLGAFLKVLKNGH